MLAVAPRRLALLLLTPGCFYDHPPGAGTTGVVASTGSTSTTDHTGLWNDQGCELPSNFLCEVTTSP